MQRPSASSGTIGAETDLAAGVRDALTALHRGTTPVIEAEVAGEILRQWHAAQPPGRALLSYGFIHHWREREGLPQDTVPSSAILTALAAAPGMLTSRGAAGDFLREAVLRENPALLADPAAHALAAANPSHARLALEGLPHRPENWPVVERLVERAPHAGLAISLLDRSRRTSSSRFQDLGFQTLRRQTSAEWDRSFADLKAVASTTGAQSILRVNAIIARDLPELETDQRPIGWYASTEFKDNAVQRMTTLAALAGGDSPQGQCVGEYLVTLMQRRDVGSIARGFYAWVEAEAIRPTTREPVLGRLIELAEDKRSLVIAPITHAAGYFLEHLPADHAAQPALRSLLLRSANGRHGPSREYAGFHLARQAGLNDEERDRFVLAVKNKPLSAVLGQRMPVVERFLAGLPAELRQEVGLHLQIGLMQSGSATTPVRRAEAELTMQAARHLERFQSPT
jgi:hypothetical protein